MDSPQARFVTRRGRFVVYGLVLVFGLVPLMLRGCSFHLEPYPALLLPTGSSMVLRQDHRHSYAQFVLSGVRPDGTEVRLNPRRFFDPIPATYWVRIAVQRFGLPETSAERQPVESRIRSSAKKHRRAARQFGMPEALLDLVPGSVWTAVAKRDQRVPLGGTARQTRAWLRRRASAVGLPDATALRVRRMRTTVHVLRDTVIDREVIQEMAIPLVP